MISIKTTKNTASQGIKKLERQIPFFTAVALTKTAADVRDAEQTGVAKHFDRPTPFTRKPFFIQRATKRNLVARVGIKTIQQRYLKYGIEGGTLKPKGKALIQPAKARLNKYGNLPKGSVARSSAKPKTFTTKRSDPTSKHLSPGIYQRMARGKLKKLVSFVDQQAYKPRYPFGKAAETAVKRHFGNHFKRAVDNYG